VTAAFHAEQLITKTARQDGREGWEGRTGGKGRIGRNVVEPAKCVG
jgi:hypothetical protein